MRLCLLKWHRQVKKLVMLLMVVLVLLVKHKVSEGFEGSPDRTGCSTLPQNDFSLFYHILHQEHCFNVQYHKNNHLDQSFLPNLVQESCPGLSMGEQIKATTNNFIECSISRNDGNFRHCPPEKSCNRRDIVAIVAYHNLTNRLGPFLRHYNQLLGLNCDLSLIMSTTWFDHKTVLTEARAIMSRQSFSRFHVVFNNADLFSRGMFLNRGAKEAAELFRRDVLIFFTDIDVLATEPFLKRCKSLTIESQSVYFPIFWHQKNPHQKTSQRNFDLREDFTSDRNSSTGLWRVHSFGMLCIVNSDFNNLGKLDEIFAWGKEDVNFFLKALKSGIAIFRAKDEGLYHQWHQKKCSRADIQNTAAWHYWITGKNSCQLSLMKDK
ncbi:chondroitin sulfate N-acetylgalactosaminyltransferase 1-like [Convolutriloba macropyga]|uniref:chondroitin sulfate N-acetylgalactosaminyltransferase 1-like n=1 Tax=Convolutriloba macropyga TaxID=536237 RepID=UPI003F51F61D